MKFTRLYPNPLTLLSYLGVPLLVLLLWAPTFQVYDMAFQWAAPFCTGALGVLAIFGKKAAGTGRLSLNMSWLAFLMMAVMSAVVFTGVTNSTESGALWMLGLVKLTDAEALVAQLGIAIISGVYGVCGGMANEEIRESD